MITEDFLTFIKERHEACLEAYKGNKENMTLPFMAKVTEETGEFANEVLMAKGMARESKLANYKKEDLEAEFADVLITNLILAHNLDINVNTALEKKMKYVVERQFK